MATASKTGYAFNGWYTASSGGTKYTASSTWDQAADDTLYAQCTKSHAVVTVVDGFGTTLSTNYVASGGTLALTSPTVTGYSFKSWTASGCSVSGSTVTVNGTTDCTVTANWTAIHNGTTGGSTTWSGSAREIQISSNSGSGIAYYQYSPGGSTQTCENSGANTSTSGYSNAQKKSYSNVQYACAKTCGTSNNADGTTRCSAASLVNVYSDTEKPSGSGTPVSESWSGNLYTATLSKGSDNLSGSRVNDIQLHHNGNFNSSSLYRTFSYGTWPTGTYNGYYTDFSGSSWGNYGSNTVVKMNGDNGIVWYISWRNCDKAGNCTAYL